VKPRPVALTIAGSDNSAGAGLQADLKTFSAFGCYGLTAATCVVAEVPGKVSAIQAIKPAIVEAQIRLCFEAFPVAAAKTGMLFSTPIIEVVAGSLAGKRIPLVVDPVMVASSGQPLLKSSAVAAYRRCLFPLAMLVTPNLDELRILSRREINDARTMVDAGRELADEYGCAFLLKGGHLRTRKAVDYLVMDGEVQPFSAEFLRGADAHGTGCAYAAAITAGLAHGAVLPDATSTAKEYITAALRQRLRWGRTMALDHFPA